jgi:hypothetical protein
MPKSRNILPPKRWWTAEEEAYLREHYADTLTVDIAKRFACTEKRVLAKANAMGLHKSAALVSETARQRTSDPNHGSHRTRLKPGNVPMNKGVKHPKGWAPGRMAEGQFQPGGKPHTWVPVGSHRVVENTLELKINDDPGPNTVRWKPVHRLVWIAANGPVPCGHKVVFRPGRKTMDPALITLDAVELVSDEELMRRNSVHRYPKEIVGAVQLLGVLKRKIRERAEKEAA